MTMSNTNQARPYGEALEAVRAEMAALKPEQLAPIKPSILRNTVDVLGCLPAIKAQRALIATELPAFDLRNIDKLETYARAAWQAQSDHGMTSAASAPIVEMAEELTDVRAVLLGDAEAMARRGLVNGAKLRELRGPNGYNNLAADVSSLISFMRSNWAVASTRGVSADELIAAEQLVDRFNVAVGTREHTSAETSESAEVRERAYTLFVRAYDQVRRAVSYVRWDADDLDKIAPSLYGPRRGRSQDSVDDTLPATPAPPAAPPPAPPMPSSPSTGSAASTGMPGESPIIGR